MALEITGIATGVGSLPGDDIDAALAMVFDELPELPHLPELPARGPGSDLIGRTACQLVDLPVDLQPAGWRLVDRAGGDRQAARALMETDLDALIPVAGAGYDGALKVSLAGPWTLASMLELPRGGRALRDAGAVRDLAASLAEAVRVHLEDVHRRAAGAQLVLQLDEPALPAVLAGRIPTASGLGVLRAPDEPDAAQLLRRVVEAAGEVPVVIHCCGGEPPLRLFHAAGASALSVDFTAGIDHDIAGELVEAGAVLWLGTVPSLGPGVPPAPRDIADPIRRFWRELGFDPDALPSSIAVTPTCGLAGASLGWAHSAYRLTRQAAAALAEAPEGTRR